MGTNVSAQLMQSPEFAPQVQGLDRQRKMAEMLMTQGFQPQQGQMVSGHYVAPSWTQQLAGLANIWAGKGMQEEADTKQKELAQALRGKQQEAVQNYFSALQGTPGTPGQSPVIPEGQTLRDDNGMLTYGAKAGVAGQAPSGPNYAKAFQSATGEDAPSWLSSHAVKALEPIKVAEGEVIQQRNPLTGKLETIAGGGLKLSQGYKDAAGELGLDIAKAKEWTPQQWAAVRNLDNQGAAARAPRTTVINQMGGSLAQIQPIMEKSQSAARSAEMGIDAANKIDAALKSGKIISGTGANQRVEVARLGQALGIANNSELLGNTRNAAQGMAQLVMLGRQQMKGEGAIANQESNLAERVQGGDINLSPAEWATLASAARRSGNYMINEHNRKMDVIRKDKTLAPVAEFYSVSPMNPQVVTDNRAKADEIIGAK